MRGFSLVELSIVLVILGLLVGGVLAGQSLIKASEMRAISSEFSRYRTASFTFRDKYFALPGDFANATAFWGRANNNADCAASPGSVQAVNGTCNGNGGGSFAGVSGWTEGESREFTQFWHQLALAGLIEGSYTGLANTNFCTFGTACPASKFPKGGWSVRTASYSADDYAFTMDYGNMMMLGAQFTSHTWAALLTPEQAWNIDAKNDDGMPATGSVIAMNHATCTTAMSELDYAAAYRLSDTRPRCALFFKKAL